MQPAAFSSCPRPESAQDLRGAASQPSPKHSHTAPATLICSRRSSGYGTQSTSVLETNLIGAVLCTAIYADSQPYGTGMLPTRSKAHDLAGIRPGRPNNNSIAELAQHQPSIHNSQAISRHSHNSTSLDTPGTWVYMERSWLRQVDKTSAAGVRNVALINSKQNGARGRHHRRNTHKGPASNSGCTGDVSKHALKRSML